jgi:hypothetical protein
MHAEALEHAQKLWAGRKWMKERSKEVEHWITCSYVLTLGQAQHGLNDF